MMHFRIFTLTVVAVLMVVSPVLAAEEINTTDSAWYWYDNAVDLANAGQFSKALQANEKALAINQNFPLAWANEAGILVQVGRYDDAIRAADTVLLNNVSGLPMKNTFAAAYYSKGDALLALGNVSGAQDSYRKANELDPSLPVPDILSGSVIPGTTPVPTTARTPLSPMPVLGGILVVLACVRFLNPAKK